MKPLVLIAAILLAAATAGAQEKLPATLEECLKLGLAGHPSLAASRLTVAAAEAGLEEARRAQLPAIVLNGSATRVSDEPSATISLPPPVGAVTLAPWIEDRASVGASLRQNLFSGLAMRARIAGSSASADAARFDLQADVARLAYEIRAAWWSLAGAVEARGVVEESRRLMGVHLEETRRFLAQGLATREELLRVESEVAQADLRVTEAASAERVARSRLALLLGLPYDAGGAPPPPAPEAAAGALPSLETLVSEALRSRPELAAGDDRLRAARAASTAARSGWYPSVALEGAWVWAKPNPALFPPEDRFESTWQIGVTASVNVGGWPAVERKAAGADLQAQALAARREALARQVTLEVADAYESVRRARERLASTSTAVTLAEETLRVVRDKRAAGLARTSDLLDAEDGLTRARLDASRAAIDLRVGLAAVSRAVGETPQ